MPYRRNNYSFVIDSSFQPFSFQEMVAPLALYKDAYEKVEAEYDELNQKANTFEFLSRKTDENPEAKAIYKGYADELRAQAEDLANNGLSMGNRRALINLKRRYQGEIGLLERAQTALDKERERRLALSAKDPSMIYKDDDLKLDKFLYDRTPDLYGISGNDLYNKGAAVGKGFSSRIFSTRDGGSTLGGYFRDYIQERGITPEQLYRFQDEILNDFSARVSVLPELQEAAKSIMESTGASGLTGNNLRRAQQQVIRGIVDNAIYEVDHKPIRDPGVMDAESSARLRMAEEEAAMQKAINGITGNSRTGFTYDPSKSLKVQQVEAVQRAKNQGKSSKGAGSEYGAINQDRVRVSWKGNNPNDLNGDADDDVDIEPVEKGEKYSGVPYDYDDLPQYAKNKVDKIIGNKGDYDNYTYYFTPYSSGLWDTEAQLDIVPKKVMKDNAGESDSDGILFDSK